LAIKSSAEQLEIDRHKYFLSEKLGFDVGWQLAERDWESNHAMEWRRQRALQRNMEADREFLDWFLQ
jgi:hypothetical protein